MASFFISSSQDKACFTRDKILLYFVCARACSFEFVVHVCV